MAVFNSGSNAAIQLSTSSTIYGLVNSLSDMRPMSISAWVAPLVTGQGQKTIIAKMLNQGAGGTGGWHLLVTSLSGVRFERRYSVGITMRQSTNFSILTDGTYTHVGMVWNGDSAATSIRIFIGGSEAVYHSNLINGSAAFLTDVNYPTMLFTVSDGTGRFGGEMSEVALWSTTLSDVEIRLLSSSKVRGTPLQVRPDFLKLYLPLDDYPNRYINAGTGVYKDLSPSGLNGLNFKFFSLTNNATNILSYQPL